MGGVRNGRNAGTPEPAAVRQEALQPGASDVNPAEDVSEVVDRHFRSAARQLREGSAARAFGELARASRTLPMTPRLAAGIVRMALLAGTEAAAITLLEVAPTVVSSRRAVRRQLARVLRRVDQLPRAAAALEALLVEWPEDRRARRVLQVLRARIEGKAVPVAGASAPMVDVDERGVLAKLPARREGAQVTASWENDDAVYLIETVVGPPLSARALSAPASTVGAAEARSQPSVSQLPEAGGGAPAAALPERGADGLQAEAPPVSEQRGPVSSSLSPPGPDARATASSKGSEALPDADARPSPVKAPPTESLKTVLEMPAVELPAVTPRGTSASEAPKTVVEMPAVVVPPRAFEFEARKTEVEMPALGDVAVPPSSGVAKTFAPGRAPLPVPWADAPDDDAPVPPPVARFDDADESEVTSEAQPFLVGADVSRPPPRQQTPASSKRERRKTPPPSEALPPPITSRAAPEPDARSGTMEVSLAELEAALASASGDAPNKNGRTSEASAGPREEDTEELPRSRKVEAQLIARRAWAELAQLYLKRADRAKDASLRADALARLAEVMENELHDPAGAARMYREIVELTGDRAALRDQVRLLAARGDASLVRRALDEAIRRAPAGRARAGALLTRGERWLHMGELQKARADFEAAESSAPGLLPVLAGMLRCVSDAERPSIAERLRVALAAAPRRALDRVEALRVLAQVAEESLSDWRLAQWAWSEVLTESPDSEQARVQLTTLTRKLGDTTVLSRLLRAQLTREARGPAARQARLELVATLDAQGDADAALEELRQAVRYEPGHKEAWLMLVERLLERDHLGEAAWALEHAATAMEDEAERERTWDRLARLWRDVMGNPERAQVYARRAEGIRQARAEREVPPPEPPRSAAPRRESSGPRAPLIAASPVLTQSSGNLQRLANEEASTTDIGVAPPRPKAWSHPAMKSGELPRAPRWSRAARARRSPSLRGGRGGGRPVPAARPRLEWTPGREVNRVRWPRMRRFPRARRAPPSRLRKANRAFQWKPSRHRHPRQKHVQPRRPPGARPATRLHPRATRLPRRHALPLSPRTPPSPPRRRLLNAPPRPHAETRPRHAPPRPEAKRSKGPLLATRRSEPSVLGPPTSSRVRSWTSVMPPSRRPASSPGKRRPAGWTRCAASSARARRARFPPRCRGARSSRSHPRRPSLLGLSPASWTRANHPRPPMCRHRTPSPMPSGTSASARSTRSPIDSSPSTSTSEETRRAPRSCAKSPMRSTGSKLPRRAASVHR
ncbi:hypothetical protein QEG98_07925 [Myxococcus sp. MxC21-1]|uniref:hypothetical protein n=1 Tax=Myxococcus sp. MxC21-1 TaxID=3041439 RepID=UPI0029301504|nr:hypothetical protein [Myxococcus sp. MxC21-1]WNZ63634.1 hypothetical protein QEG98_07925 [Myxococcus sp. MxC21-1]